MAPPDLTAQRNATPPPAERQDSFFYPPLCLCVCVCLLCSREDQVEPYY